MLIGNVTRDPDVYTTQNGLTKVAFTLAVQRRFANAQGVREADFIPIVVWRQLAELCQKYVFKGKKVSVVGTLQIRSYEKDGQKRSVAEVIADEVEFLSPKQDGAETPATSDAEAQDESHDVGDMVENTDDELPF